MKTPLPFTLFLFVCLTGCGPLAERYNREGAGFSDRGDYLQARKFFSRAVFLKPSDPVFHNNLGYAREKSGEFDLSEREYEIALAQQPNEGLRRQILINESVLYGNPEAALKTGKKDWGAKAAAVLTELLKREPNNADLHMRLGFAYLQSMNPGGGIAELERAVQLARPELTASFTQTPVQGSLLVLKQVERFYLKSGFVGKAALVQKKIEKLEKLKTP